MKEKQRKINKQYCFQRAMKFQLEFIHYIVVDIAQTRKYVDIELELGVQITETKLNLNCRDRMRISAAARAWAATARRATDRTLALLSDKSLIFSVYKWDWGGEELKEIVAARERWSDGARRRMDFMIGRGRFVVRVG